MQVAPRWPLTLGRGLAARPFPFPLLHPTTQQQGLPESVWKVGAEVTRCQRGAAVLTQALASQHRSPWRPGRHRHQQLQGNVEFSQNATHRAKEVNSYWEGCWGICFSLGFLLYWPVRKILVCVQMAMTGKKGRVSTKRDESLYHGKPASLENGSLCQLPLVCPLSIPTSASDALPGTGKDRMETQACLPSGTVCWGQLRCGQNDDPLAGP